MQGYNKEEALVVLAKKLKKTDLPPMDEKKMAQLLERAIELDFEYMEKSGVLQGGDTGDSYYDDDEAYEYIVDHLLGQVNVTGDEEMDVAQFVDAYMDVQQDYLEEKGLLGWE